MGTQSAAHLMEMEVNNVGRTEKIIHKIQAAKKVKEIEEQQQRHDVEKQGQ